MSRYIDSIPTPAHVEPKKFIVLSAPRTGTFGLYSALKILGFRPYHMVEVMTKGPSAMRILLDGMRGEQGQKEPYTRKEFDKWFANYDVIIEMPFFMIQSLLSAYPDAKFILVERSPEKWTKSIANTVGKSHARFSTFPGNLFGYFDSAMWYFKEFADEFMDIVTKGEGLTERGKRNLTEHYKEYIAMVKRTVPPGQLKVFNLEDGLGWEEICPIVGKQVPKNLEWPGRNTPDEFHQMGRPMYWRALAKTVMGISTIVGTVAVAGIWYRRAGGKLPILPLMS